MVWRLYWVWLGWAGDFVGLEIWLGFQIWLDMVGDFVGMGWDGLGWAEQEIWLFLVIGLEWGFS